MSLIEFMKVARKDVDSTLEKMIKEHDEYEKLKYALDKGKRLRPTLTVLVFRALGGKDYQKAVTAAVASELGHCASLVHDDLIDKDETRRGLPTVFKAHGVEDAVLLGHRMVSLGVRTLINHGTEILKTFVDSWDSSLRGETKDVMLTRQKLKTLPTPARKLYFDIIIDKTASLFAGSSKVGAQEAKATQELVDLFYNYGLQIGIAYQLADDYVDMKKGKIETLPLVVMSQLEEGIKKSFFELIEEGKLTPMAFLDRVGFNAKEFYHREIEEAVKNAETLVQDERIEDSDYKEMLIKVPGHFVNLMFKEIKEEWSVG